jgi:hypothetical protein
MKLGQVAQYSSWRTVALHDAGAQHYSRWNTIDFIGLNDAPVDR